MECCREDTRRASCDFYAVSCPFMHTLANRSIAHTASDVSQTSEEVKGLH